MTLRLTLLALFILTAPALSQAENSRLAVQLVTVGPGEVYWERFGHNAIVIHDLTSGDAISYNYGMFDFKQDHFLLNFLRGRMMYRMVAFEGAGDIGHYMGNGRRVEVQDLDLDDAQTGELLAVLEWNRRPENSDYRYDYFLANCSTKIRDVLDRVLGGRLERQFSTQAAGRDLRFHVNRLTQAEIWLYVGTHLGLGHAVDRSISVWEEFFLPMELATQLENVVLEDGRPLVKASAVLSPGTVLEPTAPPRWWPWFLLAGLVLAIAVALSTRMMTTWWVVTGLSGTALAALWLLTDHVAAHVNENLLYLSPMGLLIAVIARGHYRRIAHLVAGIIAITGLLALAAKAGPWLIQGNLEIIVATLPANLAGFWKLHQANRR